MGASNRMSKRMALTVTIVSGLLGAVFVASGLSKLLGAQVHVEHFAHWGYPDWFRIAVGVAETIGGGLLFAPSLAVYGACGLAVVMGGAIYTHLANQEGPQALAPLVLMGLLAGIAYARRGERSGGGNLSSELGAR